MSRALERLDEGTVVVGDGGTVFLSGSHKAAFKPPPSLLAPCSADPNPPGNAKDQQDITEQFQKVITG